MVRTLVMNSQGESKYLVTASGRKTFHFMYTLVPFLKIVF